MSGGIIALMAAAVFGASDAESSTRRPARLLWVIDGDTYQIMHEAAPQGEPVRARHFDTPEKGERAACDAERLKAAEATSFARRRLPRGSVVLLSNLARDRYGRLLAAIALADGTDLAGLMIGSGLARPYEGGRKPDWCAPLGAQ
jgi:micrococcal nuclease